MTDNEIIKALECCIGGYGVRNCDNCPNMGYGCIEVIPRIALDLINRQKAEIERLQSMCQALSECRDDALREGVKAVKKAKSETIKEFTERLKETAYSYSDISGYSSTVVDIESIDSIVKEMTEEN